jgi:hypothetical protein
MALSIGLASEFFSPLLGVELVIKWKQEVRKLRLVASVVENLIKEKEGKNGKCWAGFPVFSATQTISEG